MPKTSHRYTGPRKENPHAALDLADDVGPCRADVYQHSRLVQDRKQIRVLVLLPDTWHSPIEGSIQLEVIPDQAVNYETVSYAWGNDTHRLSMTVDGCSLSVPVNTVAALRRLRLLDRPRRIWIDAVCIDQQNVDERNHHVAMMREIYSNASENLIYLGEASSKTTKAAVDSLSAISAEIRGATYGRAGLGYLLFDEDDNRQYCDTGLGGNVDFRALRKLFSAPWFSRLWVMQEATVSITSTCFFGEDAFPLREAVRAAIWLHYKQNSIPHSLSDSPGVQHGTLLWDYVDPEGSHLAFGGSSVAQALIFAKNLASSEPRDSVYGALGLMKCLRNAEEIPFELCPDYRRKLVDVSRDAMRAALYEDEGQHSECLLQLISHRSDKEHEDFDWPSWVPRWHRSWEHRSDAGPLGTFFSADDRVPLPARTLARVGDPNRLTLIGSTLDMISDRSAVLAESSLNNMIRFRGWVTAAITFAQGLHHTRSESEIASVLIAGMNAEGRPSTETDLLSMRNSTKDEYNSDANLLDLSLPQAHREAQRFRIALRHACTNRRLFYTSKGRLGLGSKTVRKGDQVALLYGFRTPYILRQHGHGNTFKIVGEAYLEGAMYGDDFRANKATGRPNDVFVIL